MHTIGCILPDKMHHITRPLPSEIVGSEELYRAARAAFILQRTTLSAWCKSEGINRQTVEKALKGERFSRRASALRRRIVHEVLAAELAA